MALCLISRVLVLAVTAACSAAGVCAFVTLTEVAIVPCQCILNRYTSCQRADEASPARAEVIVMSSTIALVRVNVAKFRIHDDTARGAGRITCSTSLT